MRTNRDETTYSGFIAMLPIYALVLVIVSASTGIVHKKFFPPKAKPVEQVILIIR